jgi:2-polyprenyl-3-methyl-5-hydroxy-6-metoxy-1,4-benzoquinol methylase
VTATHNAEDRAPFALIDRVIRRLRARRFVPEIPVGASVLDFGCGQENSLLVSLADRIGNGVGVDPALRNSGQTGNVLAYRGTLEQYVRQNKDSLFDVVTMAAVIEHLDSEAAIAILVLLKSLLTGDGRLVLSTPTPRSQPLLEFLAFRLRIISRDEIEDHKIYYNRQLLEERLEMSGFVLISYKQFQFGMNSIAVAKGA